MSLSEDKSHFISSLIARKIFTSFRSQWIRPFSKFSIQVAEFHRFGRGGRDGKWSWYRRLDPFFDSSSRSLISFSFLRQFTYVYALSRPLAENSSSSSDFLCPMERRESRAQPLSLSFFLRRFLSPSSETDNFPPISPPPFPETRGASERILEDEVLERRY